jgi:hypothetical protein
VDKGTVYKNVNKNAEGVSYTKYISVGNGGAPNIVKLKLKKS